MVSAFAIDGAATAIMPSAAMVRMDARVICLRAARPAFVARMAGVASRKNPGSAKSGERHGHSNCLAGFEDRHIAERRPEDVPGAQGRSRRAALLSRCR